MDGETKKGAPLSMSTFIDVKGADAWRTLHALIDSGATVNLMSHMVAKEMGQQWEPTHTVAKGPGEQEIPLFGKAQLSLRMTDAEGVTQEREHSFATTILEGYDLLLRYPWLVLENPTLN